MEAEDYQYYVRCCSTNDSINMWPPGQAALSCLDGRSNLRGSPEDNRPRNDKIERKGVFCRRARRASCVCVLVGKKANGSQRCCEVCMRNSHGIVNRRARRRTQKGGRLCQPQALLRQNSLIGLCHTTSRGSALLLKHAQHGEMTRIPTHVQVFRCVALVSKPKGTGPIRSIGMIVALR